MPWIHCIEYIFFIIQDYWATCACLEKQILPWIHCIGYIFFISQDFWATCACPESRVCPEFTVLNIFFIIQDFWATCICPEKHELPWNISLYWNIFIIQDFWAICACPENRVFPEIFQYWGGGRPSLSNTSYAYVCINIFFILLNFAGRCKKNTCKTLCNSCWITKKIMEKSIILILTFL